MTRLYALALTAALAVPALAPSAGAQTDPELDADVSRLDPGGTPGTFGWSIAVDGDLAVVGARGASEAYVFLRADGEWMLEQKLVGDQANSAFGTSVAIEGDRLVVGALGQRYGSTSIPGGAAHVYVRSSADTGGPRWSREEIIPVPGEITDGQRRFGVAVAISDGRVFVGDINAIVGTGANGAQQRRSGSVFVYARTGAAGRSASGRLWSLTGTISLGEFAADGDEFGAAVSADGQYVLVGAPGRPAFVTLRRPGGSAPGQALIYVDNTLSGDGVWNLEATLSGSTASDGDRFGEAVALDIGPNAATAVVGAPQDDGDETDQGSITVFAGLEGAWTEQAVLRADAVEFGYLGAEVDIDGTRVVGGGLASDAGFGATASVFDKLDDGWTYRGALVEPQIVVARASAGSYPLGGVAVGPDVVLLGLRESGRVYAFGNVRPVGSEGGPVAGLALGAPSPNPATSRAAVTLTVETPQTVRVTLVDALGRRVRTLWDGPAAGALHLGVEAGGLAPGVYAVRVEGGAARAVRRLTVVR